MKFKTRIKNIKLKIAYDGSNFYGWQEQVGYRTVAGELSKALEKFTGRPSRIVSAGRTDAGVHAYEQVANFFTNLNINGKHIKYQLRPYLPDDILIIDSEEVDYNFHSRFSAKNKVYRYIVNNDENMHPIYNNYKAHVKYRLDVDSMLEASKYLVGCHDFKSFVKEGHTGSSIRHIKDIRIYREGQDIIFEYEGESFLYNQIRIMTGTLIKVGSGLIRAKDMEEIISSKDRLQAGATFPSQGLYLMKIEY